MNIYIGNLSHDVTEDDLRTEFQTYGAISTVAVIKDKFSGESRGFGFVDMPKKEEAEAALRGLNGKDLHGRAMVVSEARPRNDRQQGGERRGGFGGGRRSAGRRAW